MFSKQLFIRLLLLFCFIKFSTTAVPYRSEVIQTHWPEEKELKVIEDENDPGFMRRQLRKFGEMASRFGNSLGSGATTVTNAIDKVCEVVKTVIPLLAAVCQVGQFKFCSATVEAPGSVNSALTSGSMNLNALD